MKRKKLLNQKKKSKKANASDEDDDEDDKNFSLMLKAKPSNSNNNKKKKIESESDKSEEEKPKSKPVKKDKKIESDEESVDEVKESVSDEENSDKFLSGKIIATCGKLSLPSAKIIELIEKNGGKYSKSITKDVTHVICAKMDDKTQKLQKAKELGKILVTESFLKKGQ